MRRTLLPVLMLCLIGILIDPAAAQTGALPDSSFVDGVVGHAQSFGLSCESRSASDWAAFFGVRIPEAEFLYGLPASDNPEEGFVGYANDIWGMVPPRSYGVHAGPVADLLRDYGLPAEAGRDLDWDHLRAEIAAERPVIVWIIGAMWPGSPQTYTAASGERVTVAPYEHTMLLTGYSPSTVRVVDAGNGLTYTYPLNVFLASWSVLGRQAVYYASQPESEQPAVPETSAPAPLPELAHKTWLPVVAQPAAPAPVESAPEPAPAQPETYVVQSGDYLLALAGRFGLDWRQLAELNRLSWPFTIYPGQVLRLE